MLPGPFYIYKCPSCGSLLSRGSLMSGNTFGAKLFSDGKMITNMLPEFPDLTKCRKCNTIFWLSKLKEIGTYKWGANKNSTWKKAKEAEFLDIDDYFRALDSKIAENKKEELFIRLGIWRAYNDRIRSGNVIFNDKDDELRWSNNVNILLTLLDQSEINEKITIAEIYRNKGEFDKCMNIIKSIKENKYDWLKEKFINECKKQNRWVIVLN